MISGEITVKIIVHVIACYDSVRARGADYTKSPCNIIGYTG